MKAIFLGSLLMLSSLLGALNPFPLTNPVISINGGLVQDFGNQYLGYATAPRAINIMNTGTANLIVQSIEVPNPESPFVLINPPMPMVIPAGNSVDFWMIFHPAALGSVSDSLFICSNDPQNPSLRVRMRGTGIYVPPAEVQNLSINMVENNAVLNWDEVNTTIFGLPLVPDRYVVFFSEESNADHYWQLANTSGLSYTHQGVGEFCASMFYRVIAVVFYRPEDAQRLDDLINNQSLISVKEATELFESFLLP